MQYELAMMNLCFLSWLSYHFHLRVPILTLKTQSPPNTFVYLWYYWSGPSKSSILCNMHVIHWLSTPIRLYSVSDCYFFSSLTFQCASVWFDTSINTINIMRNRFCLDYYASVEFFMQFYRHIVSHVYSFWSITYIQLLTQSEPNIDLNLSLLNSIVICYIWFVITCIVVSLYQYPD